MSDRAGDGHASNSFGGFVRRAAATGRLVVQPRMGMSDPATMRAGLRATRAADATTVGTVTIDSYTRVGDHAGAAAELAAGAQLNGYPITAHPRATTRAVLADTGDAGFPVQVRHGSAVAQPILRAMLTAGLRATEGGPVSYCLPYGRTPLAESIANWAECCAILADVPDSHLETFGGCVLGQLCPPSQLVALSVLEAVFFARHGLRSVSVSYAQQTDMAQDIEAVLALRRLCQERVPVPDCHVVLYTYMGVFPTTVDGAHRLLDRSAELAVLTGAERLIVKTVAESARIPTVAENVEALERASATAARARAAGAHLVAPDPSDDAVAATQTYREARALVDAVLELDDDPGRALLLAFRRGLLDVPYCLHPDNAARTRSYIDDGGLLRWAGTGNLPIAHLVDRAAAKPLSADGLLADLHDVRGRYDCAPWEPGELYVSGATP